LIVIHNNMAKLPEGKTRLDMVKEGLAGGDAGLKKRGRLVILIERLKEDPRNERRTFRNMEGLIASVKTVGLIEPITVTPEEGEEGSYRIVTGHRRYRAAKAAELKQVEVLIREPDDELTRRDFISEIAVGIDQAHPFSGFDTLNQKVSEQSCLPRPGHPGNVEMLAPIQSR